MSGQSQNQNRSTGRKMSARAVAVAGSQKWGYAKNGTEQVGVRVQIVDGELAGSSVTWYGFFTEKSEQRTLEQLKTAGWNGDPNNVLDLPGLGTTEFELQLEEQADDAGNTYWRPNFLNKIGVAMAQEMDDAGKRSFAARMRALALASGGRPAAQPARPASQPQRAAPAPQRAPAPRQPMPPVDEPGADDLPF